VARIVLLVAFLIVVFAFHPHGTTLDIVQVVRVVLLVALIGLAWRGRRRRRAAAAGESN
jgi:uncharacterized membrane protein YqjE